MRNDLNSDNFDFSFEGRTDNECFSGGSEGRKAYTF